jgi:fructose-1-phosphate kinase PfkB-like protein
MAKQIIACSDAFVLLPIECLNDVKNLKIPTVIKPSIQEVMILLNDQKNNLIDQNNRIETIKE